MNKCMNYKVTDVVNPKRIDSSIINLNHSFLIDKEL